MNRQEFLTAISERLGALPEEDIRRSLDYYGEMLDDRVEDGMSEEEAVADMGTVEDITSQILMDTPIPKLIKAKMPRSRALRTWEIVLIVLGSPLWVSLLVALGAVLIAVAAVLLALYVVVWAVALSVWAADIAFAFSAVACIVFGVVMLFGGKALNSLFFIGGGLLCAGLAVLTFFLARLMTVGIVKGTGLALRGIKRSIIGKGAGK